MLALLGLWQAVNAHKECPSPPNPENKLCKGKPIAYLVARKFQKVGNETDPCYANGVTYYAGAHWYDNAAGETFTVIVASRYYFHCGPVSLIDQSLSVMDG